MLAPPLGREPLGAEWLDDPGRLVIEWRFVSAPDRDDAVQEAWLAHIEGRPAATAA